MTLAIITLVLLTGCSAPDDGEFPTRGVAGYVPAHYPDAQAADWEALFASLPEYGGLFGAYAEWNDDPVDGIPRQVRTAFGIKGVTPVIALGFEPDRLTQEAADAYLAANGDAMRAAAVAIAREYRPQYLGLGVEINRYGEKSPAGFEDFVAWYAGTYDAVREASPDTVVFPILQLEYLRGGGRLSGREHAEDWGLIDRFPGDAIGFTVYPFLDYASPADIPQDYITGIRQRTDKTVIVTETGWPSAPFAGIDGSEEAQAAYAAWMIDQQRALGIPAALWLHPHDAKLPVGGGLFDTVSLKGNDGSPKPAFGTWRSE